MPRENGGGKNGRGKKMGQSLGVRYSCPTITAGCRPKELWERSRAIVVRLPPPRVVLAGMLVLIGPAGGLAPAVLRAADDAAPAPTSAPTPAELQLAQQLAEARRD